MPPTTPTSASKGSSLGIPIAIVIAAALIAGAIYFSNRAPAGPAATDTTNTGNDQVTPDSTVEPVTENDHIRGNPNAPILLVEYSDYDCPFCKNFHDTMNQVMDKYGADGKVAWVYRHFPLEQLHPNAPAISAASECVAELGGNDAFWAFTDLVFDERGTNEPTDLTRLSEFAETAGVSRAQFESCRESGKYDEQIEEDVQQAIAAGGRGTPHTVVVVGDQKGLINGAQPFSVVDQIISGLLEQIEGGG
jgi:protein-disulfide isomerase